jgi:hypothetical protein
VPVELHANQMQWLIKLCVMRCYVSVTWRPGMLQSVWLRCRVRTHWIVIIIHGDQKVSVHLVTTVQKTCKNVLNSFNHLP